MDKIEIPFGAYDSETLGWTYTIPKGYTAKIEDGKIIVKKEKLEDERIRKEIIDFIQWAEDRGMTRHDYHQAKRPAVWIDYLERQKEPENVSATTMAPSCREVEQKEQKPSEWSDGEIEDRKRDIAAAIRKFYNTDYAEYLTSFLKGLSPGDNSEDEYGQKMLGIAYKLMYEHIPENLRTQEFWDSLKFMREYTGRVAIIYSYKKPAEWSKNDIVFLNEITEFFENKTVRLQHDLDMYAHWLKSLPERFNLQPKQKWSEEDERRIDAICELLENTSAIHPNYSHRKLIVWLKSIRPSWKPSKEQMVPDKYKTPDWLFKKLEQDQPEVDLNEETIRIEFRTIADKCFNEGVEGWEREKLIARHFYELGLNARKEE